MTYTVLMPEWGEHYVTCGEWLDSRWMMRSSSRNNSSEAIPRPAAMSNPRRLFNSCFCCVSRSLESRPGTAIAHNSTKQWSHTSGHHKVCELTLDQPQERSWEAYSDIPLSRGGFSQYTILINLCILVFIQIEMSMCHSVESIHSCSTGIQELEPT